MTKAASPPMTHGSRQPRITDSITAPASEPSARIAAACPGKIEPVLGGRRGLFRAEQGRHEAQDADGQVDEKDTAPAAHGDEAAADQGTGGERQAGAGRPYRHGAGALARLAIGMVEQGERVRHQDRRSDALNRARHDQDKERGRQRATERGQREQREAGQEHPARADAVPSEPALKMKAAKAMV